MIRVVIADDHAVVRTGLSQLVSSADDLELVGVAEDGDAAVTLAMEQEADVVLMDLSMPRMDGAAATRNLLEHRPAAQVVILTSFSDRNRILDALDAGAIGYLLKDAEPDADPGRHSRGGARGVTACPESGAGAARGTDRSRLRAGAAASASRRCWRSSPKACPTS